MVWSRKLPKPIYLNDGRTIGTLAAARDLMLALPQRNQANEHWQCAAELLLEAAYLGRQEPIREAGTQVTRAFRGRRDDLGTLALVMVRRRGSHSVGTRR
jgi:hypothetical protein